MKRKIANIFLVILLLISCTYNAKAIDNHESNQIAYNDYLNTLSNKSQVKKTELYTLLYLHHNINPELIDHSTFIKKYMVTSYGVNSNSNRATVLIDLMRSYMLIPDPENTYLYPWEDTNTILSDQELAYISYAKELGITAGISQTKFGFNLPITGWQLKTFIDRINQLDLPKIQTKFKLNYVIYEDIGNLENLVIPLVIEYLYSLPNNVENAIIDDGRTIIFCGDEIPGYEGTPVTGATSNTRVYLTTTSTHSWDHIFIEAMVHEYGHVIHSFYGYVDPPNNILTEEKPKLASEYRPYAEENNIEFVACAWTYWYFVGDEYFSQKYPETYKFLQDMISKIK